MEITFVVLTMFVVCVACAKSQSDVEKKDAVLNRSSSLIRAGSTVSDWCSTAYSVPCRGSGTECKSGVSVADLFHKYSQAHTEFCVCKNGYEKYLSLFAGERCRAVASTDPANAECEIDDDCNTYGMSGVVVCRLELNNLVGRCDCASGYIYDATQSTCRSYDCSTDGGSKCRKDLGPNAVCHAIPESPPVCACNTGSMMLNHLTIGGRRQCQELATYRCDNTSNLCPPTSGADWLHCDASGRCVCPRNTVLTVVPGSGLSECRALAIGGIGCITDKNCPENARCQKSNSSSTGMCLCKNYYRASPTSDRCQLAVGTSCRTATDCGDATGIPLACVRSTAANQRGVCLCQGIGTTAWKVDRCAAATC